MAIDKWSLKNKQIKKWQDFNKVAYARTLCYMPRCALCKNLRLQNAYQRIIQCTTFNLWTKLWMFSAT